MTVDGIELLGLIKNDEFKDGDKIKEDNNIFIYSSDAESFFSEHTPTRAMLDFYTDKEFANAIFEILATKEIDIQALRELPEFHGADNLYDNTSIGANREMINKLIKGMKQLDNRNPKILKENNNDKNK